MAQAKLPSRPVPVQATTRPQQQSMDLGKPPQRPWGDQLNAKIVQVGRPAPSRRMS